MKKITIQILTFLVILLGGLYTTANLKAATIAPPSNETQNAAWHNVIGNRAYGYVQLSINKYDPSYPHEFIRTDKTTNEINFFSRTMYFDDFEKKILPNPDKNEYNGFSFYYNDKLIVDKNIDNVEIYTKTYGVIKALHFDFYKDGTKIILDPQMIFTGGNDFKSKIKFYWYKDIIVPVTDFKDLPETSGNPISEINGDFGDVTMTINETTHKVDFDIYYQNNKYQVSKTLENIEFLKNVRAANYYSVGIDRFLYFMYDDGDLLRAAKNTNLGGVKWGGYSVWNTTKNEISTNKKINVYTYIELEKHNAYAYFFTPSVIIDDLISVSVAYSYRYHWQFGGQSKERYGTSTMEKDKKNLNVPSWENNLLSGGSAALAAGALFVAAGIPVVGIPLMIVGGPALLFSWAFNENLSSFKFGMIDQIKKTTLTNPQLVEIQKEYGSNPNNSKNQAFKLHLGQFNEFGSKYVEFMKDEYKYTEIIARSNGKIYIFEEGDINTVPPVQVLPEPKPDFFEWFKNAWKNLVSSIQNILISIAIVVVDFILLFSSIRNKSWKLFILFLVALGLSFGGFWWLGIIRF